ncbi:MAG: hypothetical protein ACR2RB_13380 [Gammaproteobacteria bacterium]
MAAHIGALAPALSGLSVLAYELKDVLGQIDVNPPVATSGGCVAVDVLVIPKKKAAEIKESAPAVPVGC